MKLSKTLRRVLLVGASAMMCLGLAGGASASASTIDGMNMHPTTEQGKYELFEKVSGEKMSLNQFKNFQNQYSKGTSSQRNQMMNGALKTSDKKDQKLLNEQEHARYDLFQKYYGTSVPFNKFEQIRRAYKHDSPSKQNALLNSLVRKSDELSKAQARRRAAYDRKQAKKQMRNMYRARGVVNTYRTAVNVLDSPFTSDSQQDKAFKRYLKTSPRLDQQGYIKRRLRYMNRSWKHANIKRQERTAAQEIFKDINYDREAHHLKPVGGSYTMSKVARMRAQQLPHRYSHFTRNGKAYMTMDMKKIHAPKSWGYSENINDMTSRGLNLEADGSIVMPVNGYQMADESSDLFTYHDNFVDRRPGMPFAVCPNGHRKNILDPSAVSVGIAVGYNHKTHDFYITENFRDANHSRGHYHGKVHYHDYLRDRGFRNL